MLRSEERRDSKKIAVMPLKNARSVLKLRRNRRWMEQRCHSDTAKLRRPQFREMIDWKLNSHTAVLAAVCDRRTLFYGRPAVIDRRYRFTFVRRFLFERRTRLSLKRQRSTTARAHLATDFHPR